jgi:hypothetical protein
LPRRAHHAWGHVGCWVGLMTLPPCFSSGLFSFFPSSPLLAGFSCPSPRPCPGPPPPAVGSPFPCIVQSAKSLLAPVVPLVAGGLLLGAVKASEDHVPPAEYPWAHKGLFTSFDASRCSSAPGVLLLIPPPPFPPAFLLTCAWLQLVTGRGRPLPCVAFSCCCLALHSRSALPPTVCVLSCPVPSPSLQHSTRAPGVHPGVRIVPQVCARVCVPLGLRGCGE